MTHQNKIQLFEQKQVRTLWDEDQEKWFFSIVDVVAVLTDSPNYLHIRNRDEDL
ncbi:MAG: hypothetical protein RRY39_06885 [Odoribacter sp.]